VILEDFRHRRGAAVKVDDEVFGTGRMLVRSSIDQSPESASSASGRSSMPAVVVADPSNRRC